MGDGIRGGVIRAGLDTLYFSGAHRMTRPFLGGVGMILMFHRVRPGSDASFQPNRHLEVAPAFLAETVKRLRDSNIEIISLDEAHRRLVAGDYQRRFAVLTFDDGYRDNLEYAWPILDQNEAPFTIYVASSFADGDGLLWWMALEEAIARADSVSATLDGRRQSFDCSSPRLKQATWGLLYPRLRDAPDEAQMRAVVREIAASAGLDPARQCRQACMTWEELRQLASDPLVTIGGHTVRHPILGRLADPQVRAEMEGGALRIQTQLGGRPRHFAYPVGSPSAAGRREFAMARNIGFKTAVTTRPGVLFPEHARFLTALPRISVNGEFQRQRYLDVLISGAATALWNRFRRVNAA